MIASKVFSLYNYPTANINIEVECHIEELFYNRQKADGIIK